MHKEHLVVMLDLHFLSGSIVSGQMLLSIRIVSMLLVKELESQEIHFALCSFGSSSFVWITVKLPEDIVSI